MATITVPMQTLQLNDSQASSLPHDHSHNSSSPASSIHPVLQDNTEEQAGRIVDSGPPDGGYGWITLTGCSVLAFWFIGTTYSWGVLQNALVSENLAPVSTLSWVGTLSSAISAFFAILASSVLNTLGTQKTAILGITLFGGGQIVSGISTKNIGGMFVGNGVVMGAGLSLCVIAASCLPNQYFRKKAGLANGIVYAVGGVGGAINSFMMQGLLDRLGTSWTFIVVGILTIATGIPAAWFMKDRIKPNRSVMLDWTLFKDVRFVLIFLVGVVGTFPLLVPPFFLPLYCVSIGIPKTAAALVAGYNLASAVGRIITGYLCDRIGAINTLFSTLLMVSLSMLVLWPVSQTLAPLIIFVIINGAGCGGFFSVVPTVAAQLFGSARVNMALGMLFTGRTGGYLMGAPIAGYILAAYGGETAGFEAYRPAIFYAGSMAVGAAGLVAMVRFQMSRKWWQKI